MPALKKRNARRQKVHDEITQVTRASMKLAFGAEPNFVAKYKVED